jgi:hypothetical protein
MAIGPRHRERRARNLALLGALAGFVVLVFLVTLYKMGGL